MGGRVFPSPSMHSTGPPFCEPKSIPHACSDLRQYVLYGPGCAANALKSITELTAPTTDAVATIEMTFAILLI
jgi:hypothetical protein